ncbi:unnamed protein product [Zymoseptoria tritici ST99CH_1E4]|uniref:Uncharacterized protein n=1 Tax=Zymoseptoria tritici ST99CH_1E4 TaxID=1276532 RepID=A0A2H1GKC8_ZYMTR|nr:unnamed protein product [Zymoseptoria tritici ST99CH_1E4]
MPSDMAARSAPHSTYDPLPPTYKQDQLLLAKQTSTTIMSEEAMIEHRTDASGRFTDKTYLPIYDPDTLAKHTTKDDNPDKVLFFRSLSTAAQGSEHKITIISCGLLVISWIISHQLTKIVAHWAVLEPENYTDTLATLKIWNIVCGLVLLQTAIPKFLQWVTPAFHVANALLVPFMQAAFMLMACKAFAVEMGVL